MRKFAHLVLAAAFSLAAAGIGHAGTLDDVKAAGVISCGINTGLPGFAYTDDDGNWIGFDAAFCRAVSAAVFGDPDKIKYVNLTGKNPLPGAGLGRGRRAVAQHHLDVLRATSISASPSSASTTTTARASSAARRWA